MAQDHDQVLASPNGHGAERYEAWEHSLHRPAPQVISRSELEVRCTDSDIGMPRQSV